MMKLVKVGLAATGAVMLVADPKFRRAVIGAVALGLEAAEKAFDDLVERGERVRRQRG